MERYGKFQNQHSARKEDGIKKQNVSLTAEFEPGQLTRLTRTLPLSYVGGSGSGVKAVLDLTTRGLQHRAIKGLQQPFADEEVVS